MVEIKHEEHEIGFEVAASIGISLPYLGVWGMAQLKSHIIPINVIRISAVYKSFTSKVTERHLIISNRNP